MENRFPVEDIELLCRKGGMASQDAELLLERCGGSLARALSVLEGTERTPASGPLNRFLQKVYCMRIHVMSGDRPILNICVITAVLILCASVRLSIVLALLAFVLGYRFEYCANDNAFADEDFMERVRQAIGRMKNTVRNMTDDDDKAE